MPFNQKTVNYIEKYPVIYANYHSKQQCTQSISKIQEFIGNLRKPERFNIKQIFTFILIF